MKIQDRFIKIIVAENIIDVIDIWFEILVTRDESLIQSFFRSTLGLMARERVMNCVMSPEGRKYLKQLIADNKVV